MRMMSFEEWVEEYYPEINLDELADFELDELYEMYKADIGQQ